MYLAIALVLSLWLTLTTAIVLRGVVALFKLSLESGLSVGERVAKANEEIQQSAQAETQGIKHVKTFGMQNLLNQFYDLIDKFANSSIKEAQNKAIIKNFYQLVIAVIVFVLIYVALVFTLMSLGAPGVFLFTVFVCVYPEDPTTGAA